MKKSSIDPGSYLHRYDGISRLYGSDKINILKNLHIIIVGIGGVGSWAAEALARTGIGKITLIDWDDICYSNINRQIHALDGNISKPKVEVFAERIKRINPDCEIIPIREYYTPDNAENIIKNDSDYVIDAIDRKNQKIHLINFCKKIKIPIITCGGAGGKTDPTQIKISDLGESFNDPLLAQMRKQLRKDFNLDKEKKVNFNIPCVFSAESMRYPDCNGNISYEKIKDNNGPLNLDCNYGFGSATYVTGCFGFYIASFVINECLEKRSTHQ